MIQYNLNSLQQNVRECSWRLCSLACCRIRRVARTQWVMPVFQAAVHGASPATKVATAAAIFTLDRYRRRPSVDLAVRSFYCLTYICWPTSANFRPKTRHITLTPQPHYKQPDHTTFQNVVWSHITKKLCRVVVVSVWCAWSLEVGVLLGFQSTNCFRCSAIHRWRAHSVGVFQS